MEGGLNIVAFKYTWLCIRASSSSGTELWSSAPDPAPNSLKHFNMFHCKRAVNGLFHCCIVSSVPGKKERKCLEGKSLVWLCQKKVACIIISIQ